MRSTIKDVAKQAGVSIATISRVLNKSDRVRPATRDRVLKIARKLKYSPNAAARGLITRRTEGIGLLLPDLHGEFFSEIIRGADQTAQLAGFHLIVSSSHSSKEQIESALRLMHGRVDGLIVMSPLINSEILLEHLPRSLPVVLLNTLASSRHYDCINTDGFAGARDMVNYLIRLGHRRIAMICGSVNNREAIDRLRGYRAALKANSIPHDPLLEISGDFSLAAGQRGMAQILQLRPNVTAVFAANDAMAISAIAALREAGLRIPDDISVCGFDDIPVARYLQPALTSVHVPIRDLGFMSVELILKRLQPEKRTGKTSQIHVATTLSVRASCGPVAGVVMSRDQEKLKAGNQ